MAEERAERYHADDVTEEIRRRLAEEAKQKGDFSKVQACPVGSSDVVDEAEAKLVILSPDYPHSAKSDSSAGRKAAAEILNRSGAGRNCGNMLVFLAADKTRLADLDKAARSFLAWQPIEKDKILLNLTPFQANQVTERLKGADLAVKGRIPETYVWLLVAGQKRPEPGQAFPPVEWQEFRLQGQERLAERASKKLKNDGLLVISMAGSVLRFEIDQVPLWRGDHVGVKQLVEDFAKYLYLPRVKNAQVILDAIQESVGRLTWTQDTFAYADYHDSAAGRYRGLVAGDRPAVQLNANSVMVKPGVAAAQIEADSATSTPAESFSEEGGRADLRTGAGSHGTASKTVKPLADPRMTHATPVLRRFHGSVKIDATRVSRDVDAIASSVVQHLAGLLGSKVSISVEIEAELPAGAPDHVVRTVTENCRTLKFDSSTGFEEG